MEQFEKVEKLAKTANVTFEEAKAALEATGWDLLDAMIMLEKQGKAKSPEQSEFSTSYNAQPGYNVIERTDASNGGAAEREDFGDKIKKFFRKIDENHFRVDRHNQKIIEVPIWVAVILILATWKVSLVVLLIAMFFGCKYYFVGPDKMEAANKTMDAMGNAADSIKDSISNMQK